jgi:Protein of unknown function (DUF1566)
MKRLFPIIVAFVAALSAPAPLLAAGASGFPSWSSKFTKGRFTVLPLFNGEAVLDKETGLVWERTPDGNTHTWFEAVERCYVVNHGDRQGWRLPTMEELSSLVDSTQQSPALSAGHPFIGVQSDTYWTATTRPSNQAQAMQLDIDTGSTGTFAKTDPNFKAWCVRGGRGVDGVQAP